MSLNIPSCSTDMEMRLQGLYLAILFLLVVPPASAGVPVSYSYRFDRGERTYYKVGSISNKKPRISQEFDQNTVTVIGSDRKVLVADDFSSSVVHGRRRSSACKSTTHRETLHVSSTPPVSRNSQQKIILVDSFFNHKVQLVTNRCSHGFLADPTWLSEHSSNFSLSEYTEMFPASQILLRWEENITNGLGHRKEGSTNGGLTGSQVAGLGVLLASVATSLSWMYKKKTQERIHRKHGGLVLKKLFSMKSLKQRSSRRKLTILNSKRLLGEQGNALVYKGSGTDMIDTAVEKSEGAGHNQTKQFMSGADIVSNINRRYGVNLLGVCLEGKDIILVFEFAPTITLSQHIHGISTILNSWWSGIKIVIGTAPGIHYKHSYANPPIAPPLHALLRVGALDTELSAEQLCRSWNNILFDVPHSTKVSDYRTSKLIALDPTIVSPEGHRTIWYVNPKYLPTGDLTPKSVIHGFGGVLMELLSKHRPFARGRSGETTSLVKVFTTSSENNQLDQVLNIPPIVAPLNHLGVMALGNEPSEEQLHCFCSSLADPTWLSQQSSSFSLSDFPQQILLDWEENITWEEDQGSENMNEHICGFNTSCTISTDGFGYHYSCKQGLHGNPSKQAGCQDISELEDPEKTTCEGTGENTQGSCTCHSPLAAGFSVLFATVITSPTWVDKEKTQEHNHAKNGGLILEKFTMTSLQKHSWRSEVTVLDSKLQIQQSLNQEADIVSRINQNKVVKLIEKVLTLVYEFVPNGTLSKHIHGNSGKLSCWRVWFKNAAETARALVSMHSYAHPPSLNRQVKPRKMLLDGMHTAKVSGSGTIGYVNPDYLQTGEQAPKSDVFGFGTGLKELLSEQNFS